MRTRNLRATAVLGCITFLLWATAAVPQTTLFARMKVEQLLTILTQMELKGAIVRWSDANAIKFATPLLKDEIFAYPYYCNAEGCALFEFRANLPKYDKVTIEAVNEWNSTSVIAKAWMNQDGSSSFSYGFSVEKGVSPDHVKAVVAEFHRQLRSFLGFVAQR